MAGAIVPLDEVALLCRALAFALTFALTFGVTVLRALCIFIVTLLVLCLYAQAGTPTKADVQAIFPPPLL